MSNRQSGLRQCIWCEESKQWHPKRLRKKFAGSSPHKFSQEHVLLDCLGAFEQDLTLGDLVCAECNQKFGDSMDRMYGRSGIEGLVRLKMGHKPADELIDFDENSIAMTIIDSDPVWNGLRLKLSNENSVVREVLDEAVVFLTPDGRKLAFNDQELEDLTSVGELGVPIGSEIHIIGADENLKNKRIERLRSIGAEFSNLIETPVHEKVGRIAGAMNQERQRAITKMAVSYLAKVCENKFEHILYTDEIRAIKNYVLTGESPGFNPVTITDPYAAFDIESDRMLGNGHILGVTFHQDESRQQIVCPIYIYQLLPLNVFLATDYKGALFPIMSVHHWSVNEPRICRRATLQQEPKDASLSMEQIPTNEVDRPA